MNEESINFDDMKRTIQTLEKQRGDKIHFTFVDSRPIHGIKYNATLDDAGNIVFFQKGGK